MARPKIEKPEIPVWAFSRIMKLSRATGINPENVLDDALKPGLVELERMYKGLIEGRKSYEKLLNTEPGEKPLHPNNVEDEEPEPLSDDGQATLFEPESDAGRGDAGERPRLETSNHADIKEGVFP